MALALGMALGTAPRCSCSLSWAVGAWGERNSCDFNTGRLCCQTPPFSSENISVKIKQDQGPKGLRNGTKSSLSHLPAQLKGCFCTVSGLPRGFMSILIHGCFAHHFRASLYQVICRGPDRSGISLSLKKEKKDKSCLITER